MAAVNIKEGDKLARTKVSIKVCVLPSLPRLREAARVRAAQAIRARKFANYLNCGATQPSTTRGTGLLRPVKNWRFFPPLSVERLSTPSVTKIKAKSPFQKQKEPGLQCTQSSAVRLSPEAQGIRNGKSQNRTSA